MTDVAAADPSFRCLQLRYFNPVGAHPSGEPGCSPGSLKLVCVACGASCSPLSFHFLDESWLQHQQ